MIILLDVNVWEKMAESFFRGVPKSGILIIEKHLLDDRYWHWSKDLGNKKLLGRVELIPLIPTEIDKVDQRYIRLTGVTSRENLKRTFLMFSKEPASITVCKIKVIEVEKYWCPRCSSINLDFLAKERPGGQIPFVCFDCNEEFYTPDKDGENPHIGNAWLARRYRKEEIKKIPDDQLAVLAIAGES